ncbi:uncharacterized protein C8R40DRAFT_1068836 [Lentinula edodes]|uniref:uncharacterized protein n=1 Tax=Lentinula edodes TaxID=5353 RepID=UPI001E8CC9B7|nr:uncharacterized protein C8R40DRAFT_1068836 [Lentinula edodes]KAH7876020.1 hypothetical protein C8R40DRAFT_1068836 [Lentinula edodes]
MASSSRIRSGSSRSSRNRTPVARRRLSPSHTILVPLFNGDVMPQQELDKVEGSTTGLYFGMDRAITETKKFPSTLSSRHKHQRYIDVREGFAAESMVDDIYKLKVIVDQRRYYVCGTYDQSSPNNNESLITYGVKERFKGEIAIFFYSVYEPERFLEYVPKYGNANERDEAIKRVLTAFSKNVGSHIEKGTRLKHIVRG